MEDAGVGAETETDGRHQRSARTREAVVEAWLAIMRETGAQPSAQSVAERAQVSLRTVFRLFEDVDTLFASAVAYQVRRVGRLFAPMDASGSAAARIEALAERRAELFEEIAPVRRLALSRHGHPTIGTWLQRSHDELRAQLLVVFTAELDELPEEKRRVVVEAIDAATGWPAWDALRREQGLDVGASVAVVVHTLTRLLEVTGP